jgi:hypothetical protein
MTGTETDCSQLNINDKNRDCSQLIVNDRCRD